MQQLITYKNGARLLYLPVESPFVTMEFILGVGSMEDTDTYATSVFSKAHILEHLLVTENQLGYKKLSNHLASYEAFTVDDITTYKIKLLKEDFAENFQIMFESLFHSNLTQETLNKQLNVIEIENVVATIDYFDPYDNESLDEELFTEEEEYLSNKQTMIDISSPEVTQMKMKNSNLEDIKAFYKQHYTPNKLVVGMSGGSEKDFELIKNYMQDFFKDFPDKKPFIIKDEKQIDNKPEKIELILPANKFEIKQIKKDITNYANINIFIDMPKKSSKLFNLVDLYNHMIVNKAGSDFQSKISEVLVNKRASVYTYKADILEDENQSVLNFNIQTTSKHVHTTLSSLRNLINKFSFNNYISKQEFDNLKKDVIKSDKIDELKKIDFALNFQAQKLLRDGKIRSHQEFAEIVNKIRYDDFVKFCKYVAKTSNYKVSVLGNHVSYEDLKAFDIKQKQTLTLKDEFALMNSRKVTLPTNRKKIEPDNFNKHKLRPQNLHEFDQ